MDALFDTNTLTVWLLQYGAIAIFILLTLGIIALPVPEETLMVISGILMYNAKLPIGSTMTAAYLGAICGISISYLIGRTAGHYFISKYANWIGITQQRLDKAHIWFERFGKWTLFIGYFIPGVRHFTGFVAGTTELAYSQFSVFAYSGAVLWVSLFLSIGYLFGEHWLSLFSRYKDIEIGFDFLSLAIVAILLVIVIVLYKVRRRS